MKRTVGASLESLDQKHPTHSGVLHYTIHVFDQPKLYTEANKIFLHKMRAPIEQKAHAASTGIRAAKKYPRVATSSCHALHMPSHIYLRLGNWSKSLESNLLSIEVNNTAWSTLIGRGPSRLGTNWLRSGCCYASSLMP